MVMASTDVSKAIIITFWGTLFALLVSYGLLGWKPNVLPLMNSAFPNNGETDKVILAFVLIMVIRHQCRVVFFDSTYFTAITRSSERVIMALLFPAAILGGILILLFTFGIKVGALAMAIYSLIFLIVGFFSANSHTGEHAGRSHNMAISWLIDLANTLLWFAVVLIDNVGQDRAWFFVAFVTIGLFVEFFRVFRDGVIERMKQAIEIIFG